MPTCSIAHEVAVVAEETVAHYVVVRTDLPIGLMAAQIVHAAGESAQHGLLPPDAHAVVLAVPSEDALREVHARLELERVAHICITENDPPFDGQMMAIGLVPAKKEKLRKYLSSLPLLRRQHCWCEEK